MPLSAELIAALRKPPQDARCSGAGAPWLVEADTFLTDAVADVPEAWEPLP